MNTKHTQMPHELGSKNKEIVLKPVDKLVYVYLRSHCNSENETFVSMETLANECEINWRTVSESITRLLKAQEIFLVEDYSSRRSRTYKINKDSRHFEIFSQECLDYLKEQHFTTNEKCVLICLHEFTFKTKNYGETSMVNAEIAKAINMPIASLKRALKTLMEKGVITKATNKSSQLVRRVQWEKIMMKTVYQVEKNTKDICQIQDQLKSQEEILKKQHEELQALRNELAEYRKTQHENTTAATKQIQESFGY